MASHSYIEAEDLGLTVLGTTQYVYSVGGEHRQDYDVAVKRASLNRAEALEEIAQAYSKKIELREKKIDDLGVALASVASAMATYDQKDGNPEEKNLNLGSEAASILRKYGFSASATASYSELSSLQQNVQYALDTEDNELQQDMTSIQSYVTKRDDAFSTVQSFQNKIANTRKQGIQYIGS